MSKRRARPSLAVLVGTLGGVPLAPVVLLVLRNCGVELPADPVEAGAVGSSIGALVVGVLAWATKGGRAGEAH